MGCSLAVHVLVIFLLLAIGSPGDRPPTPDALILPVELVRSGERTPLAEAGLPHGEPAAAKSPQAANPAAAPAAAPEPPKRPRVTSPVRNRPALPPQPPAETADLPPPSTGQAAFGPEAFGPTASDPAGSKDGAGLGRQGTLSVKDFIRAQIERHWNFDARVLRAADLVVTLHLVLDADGRVASAEIVDDPRYSANPSYRSVADSARRAVLVASPLQVPPGRYDAVRDMVLSFNPREVVR